ncbi:uncharacterized protein SPAPADRAFT_52722 [Spathaspora passalidarum NRRL Y-27907]|uniref:Zn(2)-C6 fungal-type domain-containing protein n=1 Tax=Spathaspora passalidarum (strain NRRL Y-27907 / 11-Y1) TaxID=619300 RepID=G3AV61_SPAPN|nr:uncharacterized protein SPAPADRAFT_52722 [Spathaspora passalidarum NRRL Y-27907]EGW29864.1 hypothetical protein SPAPADRAFT_52722 [Spathaspora passalidarum NRRL Y-27907]
MGRKRMRISKVCDFCKNRKVKCDLGNPCSTCDKFRKGEPCTYTAYNTLIQTRKDNHEEHIVEECVKKLSSADSGSSGNINGLGTTGSAPAVSQLDSISESLVQEELAALKQKLKALEESLSRRSVDNSPTNGNSQLHPATTTTPASSVLAPSLTNQTFNPISSLEITNLVGNNPAESPTETINFYDGYSPTYDKEPIRRRNFGPLSWISLTKVDGALGGLWDQLNTIKEQYKGKNMYMAATLNTSQVIEKEFSEKVHVDEGYNDIRPYRETVQSGSIKDKKRNSDPVSAEKLNEKALSIGLSFYQGGLDEEMELVEKIKLVLPKQKVIWLLYKRFFTHLYIAFPFVDEVVLKEQVQKLIGYEDYLDVPIDVKVEKKMDFAYLGILLILLRLSYLSLFSNDSSVNEANLHTTDPSPNAQQVKYLMNNPINIDAIDVAQSCLNQFNLMRSINMTLMQLALFMRLYNSVAPEDGDGINGGDAQVFNAILIQMGFTLGLHREPDNFPDTCNDEKVNNLGRKIWTYLLISDLTLAISNGTMLNISLDAFDTKAPFYKPGNENVIDVELEKITAQCFAQFDISYQPLHEILSTIMKVRGSSNMSELCTKLNYIECHFIERYGNLSNRDKSKRVNEEFLTARLKVYFTGNLFMVSLYFHIFNHYERKRNTELAHYYLKKIFAVVILDLMPFLWECVNDVNMMVSPKSTYLVIIPSYESVAHKSLILISAVYVRVKHKVVSLQSKYNHGPLMKSNNKYRVHYQQLVNIADLLLKCRDVFRECVSKLAHRYYYSWRITKVQNFLHNLYTNDELFRQYRPLHETILFNNDQMLGELQFILENSLAKVKEARNRPKQPVYSNYSHEDPAMRRFSSTPSFETTPDIATNDYKPNEQIDSIWLQMMNMKNEYRDPGTNKFGSGNLNGGTGQVSDPIYNANIGATPNILNPLEGPLAGVGTGLTPGPGNVFTPLNLGNSNELFDNYPIDELFKDFS